MSDNKSVPSICSYCGCACSLNIDVKQDITRPMPINTFPGQGNPCVKGLKLHEPLTNNRLDKVLIREDISKEFREVDWETAFEFVGKNIEHTIEKYGANSLYFTTSGEFSNETNYLIFKLAHSLQTGNVDSCARLCHAATGMAWSKSMGIKGIPTYTIEDLSQADLFVYIGSDPAEDYPSLYREILKAKSNGAKLVCCDVMESSTFQQADHKVLISPNELTEFLLVLSKLLLEEEIINNEIEGIEKLKAQLEKEAEYLEHFVEKYQFVAKKIINEIKQSKKVCLGYGMGITQHLNGVANVTLVTNIGLMLDAILFPGRGKVNVQGADDISQCFPERKDLEFTPISQALYKDYEPDIKFFWSTGMNPFHSFPDLNNLEESLKDSFVVLTHHHPCRSMEFANVVFPCTMLPEESGTIVNLERRLRWVGKLNKQTENIKAPWEIVNQVAQTLKAFDTDYESIAQITKDWIQKSPLIDQNLKKAKNPIKEIKKDKTFLDKEVKFKKVLTIDYKRNPELTDSYPYIATTARSRYHFCSGETTRNSPSLVKLDSGHETYINPKLAEELGVETGDSVVIESEVGEIESKVEVVNDISDGTLVMSYHFEKPLVNRLTPLLLDPVSFTPQFKYIPVRVRRR